MDWPGGGYDKCTPSVFRFFDKFIARRQCSYLSSILPPMTRHQWLPIDLAGAIARAGVDVTLPERQLEDAIGHAIGQRRGYIDGCDYSIKGWCVTLLYPDHEEFYGAHLAIALGWCLVWMMGRTGEIGILAYGN